MSGIHTPDIPSLITKWPGVNRDDPPRSRLQSFHEPPFGPVLKSSQFQSSLTPDYAAKKATDAHGFARHDRGFMTGS